MRVPGVSGSYLWLPATVAVLGVAAAALLTARQAPVYRAATTLIVVPSSDVQSTADLFRSLETLERRSVVATLARLPAAPATRAGAAEQLGRAPSSLESYQIDGSVVPNTNLLRVEVEAGAPDEAAAVANAVAAVTAQEARNLYRIYAMRVLAEARPPARPASPDPWRNYWVGAMVGLCFGLLAAFVLDRQRRPAAAALEPDAGYAHRVA